MNSLSTTFFFPEIKKVILETLVAYQVMMQNAFWKKKKRFLLMITLFLLLPISQKKLKSLSASIKKENLPVNWEEPEREIYWQQLQNHRCQEKNWSL
ncbi:MAG: hypothetical protein ACD_70C00052G0001 [uncultured bacterium]|nr:MAG: hypothetical protein ACD_70C00052G0001 [uncultured bacterium]